MRKSKFILLAILPFFLAPPANAQHRLGVTAGLNFADFNTDTEGAPTEISTRTAFLVGGVLDLRLSESLGLRLEPMYVQKGAEVRDLEDDIDLPIRSSFLELPILLKAEFGRKVRPYLVAGPTLGLVLTSNVEAKTQGIVFKGDMKDVTEDLDFGFSFGGGLNYPVGPGVIFVESRYTLGLSNMQKGGTFELIAGPISQPVTWDKEEDKYKNRGLQVLLGITFPLKL